MIMINVSLYWFIATVVCFIVDMSIGATFLVFLGLATFAMGWVVMFVELEALPATLLFLALSLFSYFVVKSFFNKDKDSPIIAKENEEMCGLTFILTKDLHKGLSSRLHLEHTDYNVIALDEMEKGACVIVKAVIEGQLHLELHQQK